MTKRTPILLILLLFGLLAIAGCVSSDHAASTVEPSYARYAAEYEEAMVAGDAAYAPDSQVIKEGWIHLRVRDTRGATGDITTIAERYNGRIQSLSLNSGGMRDGREQFYAEITLRVPSHAFDPVMQEIEGLGTLTQRQVKTRDVTAEYTDLHAEQKALEDQLTRLAEILQKAETVEEILKVQAAIDTAQMNHDRVTGRINLMSSQIDESTIQIFVREGEAIGIDSGFSLSGILNTGISALLFVFGMMIVAVFALLPLAVVGGIAWYVIKKRRG
ncbi:MAG: DUF4349 domain-containing protein [Methanocalculus sp. MSAO_Arc1]|uniref:DUF4349 domain-containing protein n=1 Tax=Methanocalculus TaxID=71151 RepID=UPI000FEEAF41|nr:MULTISPECIES: DUF4349 domain-containing protein [unclassified Methanocalculus]MCP1661637.1 hypothetical protein [Methanocalculus sp. AMF5]RQD81900.1 MAG: DUF4349 domain-containing protein [Methanocalculus sp. MSAO_Arc1]